MLPMITHMLPMITHMLSMITHMLPMIAHMLPMITHMLPMITHMLPMMARKLLMKTKMRQADLKSKANDDPRLRLAQAALDAQRCLSGALQQQLDGRISEANAKVVNIIIIVI